MIYHSTWKLPALIVALATLSIALVRTADAQSVPADAEGILIKQVVQRDVALESRSGRDTYLLYDLLGRTRSAHQHRNLYMIGLDANLALVLQDGIHNVAIAEQVGASNLAILLQRGSGNTSTLDQMGTGNFIGVRLQGEDNRLNVSQIGSNNLYLLDFEGSHLRFDGDHGVEQVGNGNRLIQIGQGAHPFGVQQRGNGMEMIIRHHQ